MTSELATTTGVARWQPDLGPLPDGWKIINVEIHVDTYRWSGRDRLTGLVTLRYAPFSPRTYHEVRLRLSEHTPPVHEWLNPFLKAMEAEPHPAYVDIDCEGRRYP